MISKKGKNSGHSVGMTAVSVSKNLLTRSGASKKEGIFYECEYVGVRVYGSVRIRKKQAMARVSRWETRAIKMIKLSCFMILVVFVFLDLLAVDRLF